MPVVALFDAAQWMRSRLKGGLNIASNAQACYASLALMSSLFEDMFDESLSTSASVDALYRIASQLREAEVSRGLALRLEDFAAHWRGTFGANGDALVLWTSQRSSAATHSDAVRTFLLSTEQPLSQKAFALLICAAYVKRHALAKAKSAVALNDQLVSMEVAAQSIAAVMEALSAPLMAPPRSRKRP